jgi:hypothetical protein
MRTKGKTHQVELCKKYLKVCREEGTEIRGILRRPWQRSDKGKFVITGPMIGNMSGVLGRVVQVRQKTGAFGTDTVLIREQNGKLSSHENQFFWIIPEEYETELQELFRNVVEDDADEEEYTIVGQDPVKGFLS